MPPKLDPVPARVISRSADPKIVRGTDDGDAHGS